MPGNTGVYIREQAGPHPISRVVAETTAFIGFSDHGPPAEAVLVSSWEEFEAAFVSPKRGRLDSPTLLNNCLAQSVRGYFSNGGSKAVIVRLPDASPCRRACRTPSHEGDLPDDIGGKGLIRKLYASALRSLNDVGGISLLVTPGLQHPDVVESVLAYTESRREFVYLIDSPNTANVRDVEQLPARYNSSFGALYYPWLLVPSASPKRKEPALMPVPSTGHIAGVICRLDKTRTRGVFAAPAGTIAAIENTWGASTEITPEIMSDLASHNVNCLRRLANGATAIWGIRTTDGQYMNIRRGITFVERSIKEGLGWAIFEATSPSLWSQLELLTDDFLFRLYCDGMLSGNKPSDAYFVRCNAETNTALDVSEGRVNMLVGLALLRPAEFEVLKISLQCVPPSCPPVADA